MDIERILSANPNLSTPGGIKSAIKKERGVQSEEAIKFDGERRDRSGYQSPSDQKENEPGEQPIAKDADQLQLDPEVGGHLDVRV